MKRIIGCLQMNSSSEVTENLETVARFLPQARDAGIAVLQLPENFAQMPKRDDQQAVEQFGEGAIQHFLSQAAAEYQITLIAGSIPIRAKGDVHAQPVARCLVFDDQGNRAQHYDKIHLFNVQLPSGKQYRESDRYRHGAARADNVVVGDLAGVQVGLSICYDLRFPELYRQQVERGAALFSVPAAFTWDTGKAHWQTLLTTRAVENLSYVFAAAQTGEHDNGRQTWGHSMIISPWGEVLANAEQSPCLISAEIDLTELQHLRERFPALKHRRL